MQEKDLSYSKQFDLLWQWKCMLPVKLCRLANMNNIRTLVNLIKDNCYLALKDIYLLL